MEKLFTIAVRRLFMNLAARIYDLFEFNQHIDIYTALK